MRHYFKSMLKCEYKTWIEISRKSIEKNIKNIKRLISNDVLMMAVIKSNAYGIGIDEMVEITKSFIDWFGVNSLEEANEVRKKSNKPILILSYTPKNKLQEIVKKGYSTIVYDYETAMFLSKYSTTSKKAKIHIKVDTGLTRLGLLPEELFGFIKRIKKIPNIKIEGIFTHYSKLMDRQESDIYTRQLNKFKEALNILQKQNITTDINHTASSMASILYKDTHFDMVRIGILMCGLWGGRDMISLVQRKGKKIKLSPALSLKTSVINIKTIKKGISVGYMNSWVANKKTIIAIVGAGFYDGIDRRYAKKGKVIIRGQFAEIVGKIAMNNFIIDISNIKNVKIDDTVTIIGKSNRKEISAYDIAETVGTSTYEVMTRINSNIHRVII